MYFTNGFCHYVHVMTISSHLHLKLLKAICRFYRTFVNKITPYVYCPSLNSVSVIKLPDKNNVAKKQSFLSLCSTLQSVTAGKPKWQAFETTHSQVQRDNGFISGTSQPTFYILLMPYRTQAWDGEPHNGTDLPTSTNVIKTVSHRHDHRST